MPEWYCVATAHHLCYNSCTPPSISLERQIYVSAKAHIVVVNDDTEFLDLMKEFLTEEGYQITAFPKHQGAFEKIKESGADIVVCDLVFGNQQAGWSLIDMLYFDPETRAIPLILCTAATHPVREIVDSLAAKGITWLEKPFELERLLEVLEKVRVNGNNGAAPKKRHA